MAGGVAGRAATAWRDCGDTDRGYDGGMTTCVRAWPALLALAASVASLAPARADAVDDAITEAERLFAARQYPAAAQAYHRAEALVYDAPSEAVANRILAGLARVDAALIAAAVESTASIADDLEALAELHKLHVRLRAVGDDAVIARRIVELMSMRATLAIAPHEDTDAITDLAPVLAIARYPELDDGLRRRLSMLAAKPWRILDGRAASSVPLVAQTFAGLAARVSGHGAPDRRAVADPVLAPFRRGTTMTVTAAPGCESYRAPLEALAQVGALRVDATVSVTRCQAVPRDESRQVHETYTVDVPYEAVETVSEKVCQPVTKSVSYCVNPYTHDGCVGSSDTVASYECHVETYERLVTRYRAEPRERDVMRTFHYVDYAIDLAWTRTALGQTTTGQATLTGTDGADAGFDPVAAAVARLRGLLDEPVAETMATRAGARAADGAAAIAAGRIDDGEAALLEAIHLGGSSDGYFLRTYAQDDTAMRAALDAVPAGRPAFEELAVEPLPAVTDQRRADGLTLIRDRFAAQFPPPMSRVKGFWYSAELGALVGAGYTIGGRDAGGGTAPAFGIRFGTPVLARVPNRTAGPGLWDDLSWGGNLAYTAASPANDTRGVAARGHVSYAAALGFRLRSFQLLGGARAEAAIVKIGATHGTTAAVEYYGNLGFRIGGPSLTVELWWPASVGARNRGGQVYFVVPTSREQYQHDAGHNITSYLAFRFEDQRFDGCLASAAGCVDRDGFRVFAGALVFGTAFR